MFQADSIKKCEDCQWYENDGLICGHTRAIRPEFNGKGEIKKNRSSCKNMREVGSCGIEARGFMPAEPEYKNISGKVKSYQCPYCFNTNVLEIDDSTKLRLLSVGCVYCQRIFRIDN